MLVAERRTASLSIHRLLEQNLGGLCEAVRQHGADAGFAEDPDADQLAIVDNENGRYIGEELTLARNVPIMCSHERAGRVCRQRFDQPSQRPDIAEKHGCEFHRSWVGEANVTAMMREKNAILGGEGNGKVIEPQVGCVRDSSSRWRTCSRHGDRRADAYRGQFAAGKPYAIVRTRSNALAESRRRRKGLCRQKYADATPKQR